MTEWERQRAHVNRVLDEIARTEGGPDTMITVRLPRHEGYLYFSRAELVRLLHAVEYERTWCEREERKEAR